MQNFDETKLLKKNHILEMFTKYAYRLDMSPLLEQEPDMFGEDGHSVYISWIEDDEGNLSSCTIPHSSLEVAELIGKEWHLKDDKNESVVLKFYKLIEVC